MHGVSGALEVDVRTAPGWSEPLEAKQEGGHEVSEAGAAVLAGMRHSRSLPSLASADLITPRNLIEVSARVRQQHDHHDGRRSGSRGSQSPRRASASGSRGGPLLGKALSGRASASSSKGGPRLGKVLSGKSLSGKGSALSSRASSIPSIASSRELSQSLGR